MKSSKIKRTLAVMLCIFVVWTLAVPLSTSLPDTLFKEPLPSVYNGLNVLFTALAFGGVAVTLLFQAEESEIARREEIERSIFELFQTFTSLDFQKVKDASFRVLLAAIKNRKYAEYLASRLFVVDQKSFPSTAVSTLSGLDKNKLGKPLDEVIHLDRDDRLMLDNILNFFALLAQRETSATVIKHCDFAYDWWRPALWLLATLQEEHYNRSEVVRMYCKTQLLKTTLTTLDGIYGHEGFLDTKAVKAYINGHPKMVAFGIHCDYGVDKWPDSIVLKSKAI